MSTKKSLWVQLSSQVRGRDPREVRSGAVRIPASRRQEPEDYLLIAQGINCRLDGESLRLEILFLGLTFGCVTRLCLSLGSQFLGLLLLGGGGHKQAVRLGLGLVRPVFG